MFFPHSAHVRAEDQPHFPGIAVAVFRYGQLDGSRRRGGTALLATSTLATQHTTHERVGRAEALLRAGRAYLYETVRELPPSPTWCETLSDDLRARLRLASTHAAQSAAEAVDLMFNAAGTTAIYASSRLERCFRDVHVATQHVTVAPSNIEMVGQYFLGLGLQARR